MRSKLFCATIALLFAAAEPALAETINFKAHLTGHGEVPANDAGGKGDLVAQVDTDTHVLTYKVTYKGLSGPATMAHFHGPAKASAVAPPIIAVDDPSSPISGHASVTDAQISQLEKGLWYFNVHTAANPGGEIRGQVKRVVDWAAAEAPAGQGQDLRDMPRMPTNISNR
ncbi:MAG TPA: CHRD domain-containing protein [Caulobacteraceae bacterium]|nr:CHRD domain-containing protein [Caulobacteraceae bacterium]